MVDTDLPDCQFDPADQRDNSSHRYAHALKMARQGKYLERNLDHLAMAMEIRQIAKRVEDPKCIRHGENLESLWLTPDITHYIRKDGTWKAYRDFILLRHQVDMGPVPDDAEKPSLAKIEGTIQNWLNGEPLLFY